MKSQFNELLVLAEKVKKKGGSMASIFKLIENLLDFEEKIQDCVDSQEMAENKQKIESFLAEIDKMYDVLFEMARGGISSIRTDRSMGMDAIVEEEDAEIEIEGPGRMTSEDKLRERATDTMKPPIKLNAPRVPSM